MTRTILWIAFCVSVLFFYVQGSKFHKVGVSDIEDYEYADAGKAIEILASWEEFELLQTVRSTIRYDFFFILVYLMLMIGCSNDQLTVEWSPWVNSLLRLNIALALPAALLDLSENLILLHNISTDGDHINSYWITLFKFILAYWIAGVWLFSKLKTKFLKGSKQIHTNQIVHPTN